MNLWKLCMLAVMGLTLALTIKTWKADLLPLLRIAIILLFGTALLTAAEPLLQTVQGLTVGKELGVSIEPLFKAVGIAVLTESCADICRESGESGIAKGVELAGKVEILLLCIPLINQILDMTRTLLETGGAA